MGMIQKALKKKHAPLIAMLFVLAITAIYLGVRVSSGSSTFPGIESSQNLYEADLVSSMLKGEETILTMQADHDASVNIYTFLLAETGGDALILLAMNIVLAMLVLMMLNIVLKHFAIAKDKRTLTILFFGLSPLFIYYAASLAAVQIFTLLSLSSLLFLKRRKIFFYLISLIIPLFGIELLVVHLIIILAVALYKNRIRSFYEALAAGGGLMLLLVVLGFAPSMHEIPFATSEMFIREFISEFGGSRSLGIMLVTIAAYGFIRQLLSQKRQALQFIFAVSLMVLPLIEFRSFYFLGIAAAVYAADGASALLARKWYSNDLKMLTIVIIMCGFLFTLLSYSSTFLSLPLQAEEKEALDWFAKQPDGNVLTGPFFAYHVRAYSGKPVVATASSATFIESQDVETIFQSFDLDATLALLRERDVDYIVLTDEIKERVWSRPDQGLLFLFSNDMHFRKLYADKEIIEIWAVNTSRR
ncbi:MAG: hypothetical protein ACOC32_01180 [Nanoarchaeota archaeon]